MRRRNRLYAGQDESCPGESVPYTIKSGDTLYKIAMRLMTTVDSILELNPGIDPGNLQVGQVICVPGVSIPQPQPCQGTLYTIKRGDTLVVLAQSFRVPLDDILAANPGIDPRNLQIGQQICIPTEDGGLMPSCCTVLRSTSTEVANARGAVLVSAITPQVGRTEYNVTFVATGLPNPTDLGNFNTYLGGITLQQPAPGEPPLRRGAILASAQPFEQPVTWSGTLTLDTRPKAGMYVEIRPFNIEEDISTNAVLGGNLTDCRG